MEDFKQIQENLIELLEDLNERLSNIDESKTADNIGFSKTPEQIVIDNNEIIISVSYTELEKIKKAISCIDQGTYGIFLMCGQAIKKEHLRRIVSLFNANNQKIWPKWFFHSKFSILGQAPSYFPNGILIK